LPVEIAAPVLEVLIALGFARRSGDRYEAVEGLQPMLTDEAMGQLLANLRTTYQQSRELVDRAKRHALAHAAAVVLHGPRSHRRGRCPACGPRESA
jgi:hypothetical protein